MRGARTGRRDAWPTRSFVPVDKGQAPSQFPSEQLEEVGTAVELHQLDCQARSGDLDLRSRFEVGILLPVAGQDGRRVGQPKGDSGLLGQDDRSVEEAVRVQGHEYYRSHVRMEDWAAQGHGVPG